MDDDQETDLFAAIRGKHGFFKKVLCANRGEIALRVFRACHDSSIRTCAIYSKEDRLLSHRTKADEAYEISGPGITPISAYLHIDAIIAIAKAHGVDAIHPGYGFLSENPKFARACEAAGITFIGPTPDVIEMMGDKTLARKAAIRAGVPVVPGSENPLTSAAELEEFVDKHGLPIIIKAAFGGGGRGMRVVRDRAMLQESFARATSEALQSFGDGAVFVERYIERPRHVEVQILADGQGNVIHLFERDCSIQRRHQKVVEMAPAQNIKAETREGLLRDAVNLCKSVGYRNAGTVEFLVDQNGAHYFIEVNPRIQVEHTVTEEVTGVDLVVAQIEIAGGSSLADLGLTQDKIACNGVAIQVRMTTEDPAKNFQPDTGFLEVYRAATGAGIRLDGAHAQGGFISPHYDSLLVKVTARGPTFMRALRRLVRAITEFRIRGVKTNIPFLQKLLTHPKFIEGGVSTSFIEEEKSLFVLPTGRNRAQKLLYFLADVAVNGAQVEGMVKPVGEIMPALPIINGLADPYAVPPEGFKQLLDREGPLAYAKALRNHKGLLLMDTTWRDAHQSLLMTRMRTFDIARVAPHTAHVLAKCAALECWGGATFDVCLRFLKECPWKRLRELRKLVPNVPFQMLLRGANAVGYTSYPDNVVFEFVKQAKNAGVDVFRIFDSLNYMENMRLGVEAVRRAGGVIEASVCYTGDISATHVVPPYTLAYYMDLVDQLVQMGTHIIGIKDMAGLLKPQAATMLVSAIRAKYPDIPIHVHTHDTAGTGVASMIAAAAAGADVVDGAIDSMSGMTSQPSLGAIIASTQGTPLDTGINLPQLQDLNDYWQQVRELYACFDPGLTSGSSDVYYHEMPGGQYTNLLFQSRSLGLGDQWPHIKKAYAEANILLGNIVKVTPSSKVCGDLAQFMVQNNLLTAAAVQEHAERLNFPQSVVQYFQGHLGEPPSGFPEPLRSQIVKNLPCVVGRPGVSMPPTDLTVVRAQLREKFGQWVNNDDVMSYVMYPKVFEEYATFINKYGDVSILNTHVFLRPLREGEEISVELEPGKVLIIKLVTVGHVVNIEGFRDVFFELNGMPRRMAAVDNATKATTVTRPKADPNNLSEIGAPMSGGVLEVRVQQGQRVAAGDPIAVLSAMKMETIVSTPLAGVVQTLAVKVRDSISAGDLIAVIGAA